LIEKLSRIEDDTTPFNIDRATQIGIYKNIGGLECSGTCLSSKMRAYGRGTQANLFGYVLLLEPLARESPVGSPLPLSQTLEA
jgi:hypothetical protein